MISILLSGCNGNMGKTVTEYLAERNDCVISAGVDLTSDSHGGYTVFTDFSDVVVDFDVILDFSVATALDSLLEFAVKSKKPLVICTTGYSNEQILAINEAAKTIPVFFSYNMSLGISLLTDLAVKAAKVLGDDFDIEIVEKHHNKKIDAPSGTAYKIAEAINASANERYNYKFDRHSSRAKRDKNEIGIHSVRGGTIVGEHEIIFAGNDEVLTLSHSAYSKRIFACGAINAVKFLADKDAGIYSMSDLV